MFCYQCQETANCTGCTLTGVCGKNPQVAAAQDLLVYVTKGYCEVTTRLRKEGTNISDAENRMVVMNLFMTITNANFDKEAIENRIHDTLHVKKELLKKVKDTSGLSEAALWDGSGDWEVIAGKVGVLSNPDEDIRSLQQLITYGIKGLCAYTKHANALMHTDPKLDAFIQETLAKTLDNSLSAEELVALTLKTGEYGVKGMAMLDAANTGAYGDPEITAVNIGVRKNPGILVSGHDLRDLEMLLEQTKGTGVDVYTHSEMLPACSYPAFKKYPHFVGNYGNAWWQQKEEFESFNGPILMTTNCIVPPKASYKDRLYTTGAAGYPGCTYIPGGLGEKKDFSQIIEQAKKCDAVLMGSIGGDAKTSPWYQLEPSKRPEAGLLQLRKGLNLFANLRPAVLYDELKGACPLKKEIADRGFDLMIMRELTGGLYFGKRSTEEIDGVLTAKDELTYNENEIRRIAKRGFDIAMKRNKKVTSVDKANVLDSSRLWRKVVEEVAKDYPEVTLEHMLVDNCAMQLVKDPAQFDVVLTENMFGDILSDEASMVTGSIGMLASASLNDTKFGLYEPSGGSAPDIAGKGIANPIATILSAAMMLRFSFDLDKEADAIENAVAAVLKDGYRTIDIMSEGKEQIGTAQMGDKICEYIK